MVGLATMVSLVRTGQEWLAESIESQAAAIGYQTT